MSPTIDTQPLTTARRSDIINIKGGERTASEWEELEKLSKDELIIELVKERTAHRLLDRGIRGLIEMDYPADRRLPVYADDEDPEEGCTTDDWAVRIARYAYDRAEDKECFSPYDLRSYGLSDESADKAYLALRKDGTIRNDRFDLEGWFRWSATSIVGTIMKPRRSRSKRM